MAKKKSITQKNNLPGSIYKNNKRYWWLVQLPGEKKRKAHALRPQGSKFATTDLNVAIETAKNLYETAIFSAGSRGQDTYDRPIDTIAALSTAYMQYVDEYYRQADGNVTAEPQNIRYSLKPLVELFPSLESSEFGPLKLIEVRNHMIALNWSRGLINQRIGRIKRMFRWAVTRELVSPLLYQGLMAIEGLKMGRSGARETKPVLPVDESLVYAVLPYTTNVVASMIELLLLTGMRPGELVIMRPCDIDRSGDIWHYTPSSHKTQYRKKERIISVGPKGQKILMPFLLRNPESYCFSPAESERQRREKLTENRKTPLSCGNTVGSKRKDNPEKLAGDRYDSTSLRNAARYAMTACRKAIRENGGEPDIEMPYWTLYQLRHTAGTKVRKEFGYESAGATLGHTKMSATEVYAERNQGLADEAARRIG